MGSCLLPGSRVVGEHGAYFVVSPPKIGGMGYVHEGEGPTGQRVALKTAREEGTDRDDLYRQKLLDEIEILRCLDHPNIVRYIDHVLKPLVLVMEYIEGPSFFSAFRGKPASEDEARTYANILLDVLEHLHSRNILYRDLKPQNIIKHSSRTAVLIDFGAAKLGFLHQADLSRPGTIVVSTGWSAPEQETRPGEVTEASDIYASGAVLFFILTGKEPMQFMRHDGTLLKEPHDVNPSVSKELSEVILRAVQSDPRLRPQTADDMRRLLKGTWQRLGVPNIIVGGTRYEIRDALEIGRRHDCGKRGCSTKRPLNVSIDDPQMYIAQHQARFTLDKSGRCWVEDLKARNRIAVSRVGKGWHVLPPGSRYELNDKDVVALVYADSKGPYVTSTFNAS